MTHTRPYRAMCVCVDVYRIKEKLVYLKSKSNKYVCTAKKKKKINK